MEHRVRDTTRKLTREEVNAITPREVHAVLGRTMLVDGFDFVYDLDKSHDAFLFDSRTGKEYLDFFSFFASWPISMKDPAFVKEIGKVALHNPANSDIYTVEMAKFVATWERVAMPPEFKHLFFVQSGSLAVENALKAAFDWKVQKNLRKGKGELGKKVLHFRQAFHGRAGYTVSITNTADPKKYMYFPLWTSWPRVSNPKASFPLEGKNLQDTIEREQQSLAEIKEVLRREGDDVACIILEPVQGEGGDNHFRPEFWQALRRLANEHEVLLISDEVQAGMGLSGKFWTYQHLGAVPDIICFGKKSQVCGIMATNRIDEIDTNVFTVSSRINSTWGGNLVDMVRAKRFLEIIEEERLVENAASVGRYLLDHLETLQKSFPSLINNVRGKGLLCAFEAATPDLCNEIKSLCLDKGVFLVSCGTQTIRFRPFLDVKKEYIDIAINALKHALTTINNKSKKAAL